MKQSKDHEYNKLSNHALFHERSIIKYQEHRKTDSEGDPSPVVHAYRARK